MADWCDLPGSAVVLIGRSFGLIEDFIAFRATCSSWLKATTLNDFYTSSSSCPKLPLLMSKPYDFEKTKYVRMFEKMDDDDDENGEVDDDNNDEGSIEEEDHEVDDDNNDEGSIEEEDHEVDDDNEGDLIEEDAEVDDYDDDEVDEGLIDLKLNLSSLDHSKDPEANQDNMDEIEKDPEEANQDNMDEIEPEANQDNMDEIEKDPEANEIEKDLEANQDNMDEIEKDLEANQANKDEIVDQHRFQFMRLMEMDEIDDQHRFEFLIRSELWQRPEVIDERKFFSLSKEKTSNISLPESQDMEYRGSKGWLIMVERSTNNMSLLHPISRRHIPLPDVPIQFPSNGWKIVPGYFKSAVLSASPSETSDYVVMVVFLKCTSIPEMPGHYQFTTYTGYWKPGNLTWTQVDDLPFVDNLNYYNGKFYALTNWREVWMCDLSGPNNPNNKASKITELPWGRSRPDAQLVGCEGRLLIVAPYFC